MALTALVVSSVTTPGVSVIFDKAGTDYYPVGGVMFGAAGALGLVQTSNPLPAQLRNSAGTEIAVSTAPVVVAPASSGVVFQVAGQVSAAQSGTWTVAQGGIWSVAQSGAWVVTVAGVVSLAQNTSVVAQQGGAPWSVSQSGTWNVNAVQSGAFVVTIGQMAAVSLAANASVLVQQGGAPWSVNAAQSGAYVVTVGQIPAVSLAANASVLVQQGSAPWSVSQSGAWAVSVNGAVSLQTGTNTIGNVGLATRTTGGLSVYQVLTSASTNAVNIKAAAGQVYGYAVFNNTANPRYLKIYDKATVPLPASDVPSMTIIVPGASAGAGANMNIAHGVAFANGIGIAITTSIALNDNSVTSQNDVILNLFYV